MSPPTRFAFHWFIASGLKTARARMQSRKPGAKRSTCASIASKRGSGPAIGYVAIGPRHVLAGGRPAGVKKSRLGEQDKGAVAHLSARWRPLRSCNLVEGAAQVDGAGAQALPGAPRNRLAQRPIHFEDAGTVAVTLQLAAEGRLNLFTADAQQLPGGHIQES